MIVELFFLALFTNDFIIVHSEYSAPLHFVKEPSDVQFSSKTSAYLHCIAKTTSNYASDKQILISWRFENGSRVRNISNIVQSLPNGTLWFKPFNRLIPTVHRAKYQCEANLNLHNQAILSRLALVHGVVLKPFQVKVEDQYVFGLGGKATFTCIYPQEVSSFVKIKMWFADKDPQEAEPSGNLVVQHVENKHSSKLYYCVIANILTKETQASNVAKIFIKDASEARNFPLKFSIFPVNKTVVQNERAIFECLASRSRDIEYRWKHNNEDIKLNDRYSFVDGRSLRIMDTVLVDNGKYTCVALDKVTKEEISISSYLRVQIPLLFRTRPSKVCTPYYMNVTFPCDITGYPKPTITWYKNAKEIDDNNNKKTIRKGNSLTVLSTWGRDEGIYQCIASNGLETIHQAVSLIVGAQAPRIIESFKARNLSLHSKLDISCKATGKQQANLLWYRDGTRIMESSDHRISTKYYHDLWTLQIRNVTAADSGIYRCEAMNRAGSNFSEAKILVKGPAKVTYLPETVQGLLGQDVKITCKANGFPRAKITWEDKNGVDLPFIYRQKVDFKDGESILTVKGLTNSDKGRYKCKASSDIGTPDFASSELIVNAAPEESHKLFVADEGSKKIFFCSDGSYWMKNGDILRDPAFINVIEGSGIILKLNDISENDAGNFTCHKKRASGVYKEIYELVVITRPRFVNPGSPNTTEVLENEDIRMTCTSSGFPIPRTTWRRKVGGSFDEVKESSRFHVTTNGSLTIRNAKAKDETDYSCEIRNSHSHRADRTIKLNVKIPARIVNWISSAWGDAGNMTRLNCEASGDEIINFTWFKDGQKVSQNSNRRIQARPKSSKSTLIVSSLTANDRGNYSCKVFNSFGKDKKTMELIIRDKPDPPRLVETNYTKMKTSITIFWMPSFDGNSPIIIYQIDYSVSPHFSKTAVISVIGQKTSCRITELDPYTRYKVRVRAKNALGMSDFSNTAYFETAEDVPSSAPNMTVTPMEIAPNKARLKITWRSLDVKDANGEVKGYIIWLKENSNYSFFKRFEIKPIDGTQTTIPDLKPYTYYKLKIQAFTRAGYGPNSSFITKRTLEGVPSKPPGNVQVISKSSTTISLSWKAPSKEKINGVLIGYRVYYRKTAIESPVTVDTSANQTSLTLNNLGKYTKYLIRISARTGRGPGQPSKQITDITDEDIPGPPKNLRAITTSVRSVKLTWSPPDEPNGEITYYKIYYVEDIEKKDTYNIRHVDGSLTSHEIENLTENRTYYFRVCAKTSKGEGNCTADVMTSTSKGPPSFIDNHSTEVTARWKTGVTLTCRFTGFPMPTIAWLDSEYKPLSLGDKYIVNKEDNLIIRDLNRKDSKRYVCKVSNKWGTVTKGITLKVQVPPDPPKYIKFHGVNSTAVKISWVRGEDGNSIITEFILEYRIDSKWEELRLSGYSSEFIVNNIESGRKYSFRMKAINEIGAGNFSKIVYIRFIEGAIIDVVEEQELEEEVETSTSHKTIFKDSAVLGTLIGVCLFIIIVIVVLALLTKLGYRPGSKLAQRSVEFWRWFVAKGISAKDSRNMKRRSGGSSTDGHLGGSSSSLSQGHASNNGSTFSLPRSSSRVTESGYATSAYPIPLPFGNHTPGPNGGARASGSSDEGIGPETQNEVPPGTGESEYPSIPPRSSNGTPAPPTLMMSSREYINPEGVEQYTSPLKRQRYEQDKMTKEKENKSEDISPDMSPRSKEKIYFQSLSQCVPIPINMSPGRPKYEDGHFIIGPDVDRILAYRPPRCYDSTSSEYSSSRDELAQAYEFGKFHHLDDFYGRPTLESASSSGETASSEKDGICHFTSELSVGRPFLIPVAILPPPPNQRVRTRERLRNQQGQSLNTYYEKDETLV